MKIVIPGGSGHIGTLLSRALTTEGHEVIVLSRAPKPARWRVARWDGVTVGDWTRELDGADVVINLAGRSVNCRYNAANRSAILASRVRSTQAIGVAMSRSPRPPRIWLQMSTATIYAHSFDAPNDERSGVIGGAEPGAPSTWRFSIDVACAWEAAAAAAVAPSTRQVVMRSAMVMSPEPGGVFEALHGVVRLGLGGRVGDGRQFVSWIHEQDFIAAVRWLIEHDGLSGIVNLAAPNPLPQEEFMRILRRAMGVPFGLSGSAWMVEVATLIHRTESELLLKSRRVIPTRLLDSGFAFRFPNWTVAAADLVGRRSQNNSRGAAA